VYHRDPSGRQQEAVLHPGKNVGAQVHLGAAVALDGNRLAAGAPGVYSDNGAVYVYTGKGKHWKQKTRLVLSNDQRFVFFGSALAMDDGTLMAGAPGYDAGEKDTGLVMVYTPGKNGDWSQSTKLQPDNPLKGERFGSSVALHGNLALVGAPSSKGGAAYLFEHKGEKWSQVARLSADLGDKAAFGRSVAINGDTALVGAAFTKGDSGDSEGAAFVYTRKGGRWKQTAVLHSSAPNRGDQFGDAVALQDGMALVSSPRDDKQARDAGAVLVFAREGNNWKWQGRLTRPNAQTYEEFGRALAVDDGVLLVGTPDGAAPGGKKKYPGTVTSYNW